MKNKKVRRVLTVVIAVSIILAIYFIFIRSWRGQVDAEPEIDIMRNVSYFNNKSPSDSQKVLSNIYTLCRDRISFYDNQEINNNGFERWSDFDPEDDSPVLTLSYYFQTRVKNENKEKNSLYSEYEDTYLSVYIYAGSDFSFDLLRGPVIYLPSNTGASPPYLIEDFDKEFGKFRPIFNLMSKHGKEAGFEYYISPLIATKDDMGWPTNYGDTVRLVFIKNGYTIYILDDALSDNNYRYRDVIADLYKLFKQAEAVS